MVGSSNLGFPIVLIVNLMFKKKKIKNDNLTMKKNSLFELSFVRRLHFVGVDGSDSPIDL